MTGGGVRYDSLGGVLMFFSIIVSVYNTEAYLDKCLQSILHQTFTDFEVILIDDGSQDKSVSNPEHFTPHVRVKETSIPENWKP